MGKLGKAWSWAKRQSRDAVISTINKLERSEYVEVTIHPDSPVSLYREKLEGANMRVANRLPEYLSPERTEGQCLGKMVRFTTLRHYRTETFDH